MRTLASLRRPLAAVIAIAGLSCAAREAPPRVVLAIHGGAGVVRRAEMTPELESSFRRTIEEALRAGHAVIGGGGSSLDAVEAAIVVLEDSSLFNAGRGAVFTGAGANELDASIMDGRTLAAGAVGAVRGIKNPIRLARLVMERTWHVLLVGDGAAAFAREQGVELAPDEYFWTERRWRQLERAREQEAERAAAAASGGGSGASGDGTVGHGTVGAVALDREGRLAAGTSTGGLTNKRPGRVGDSPIVGAGTWADDRTCAVSGTGQGEYFIRGTVARDIAALMEYRGLSLRDAADEVIRKLGALGGTGGVIAIDASGAVVAPFNTEGMYRGWIDAAGNVTVRIHGE